MPRPLKNANLADTAAALQRLARKLEQQSGLRDTFRTEAVRQLNRLAASCLNEHEETKTLGD